MRTITKAELITSCKNAMNSGILAAMAAENGVTQMHPKYLQCRDGRIYCCAIGSALTPAEIALAEGNSTGAGSCGVGKLVATNIVAFEDFDWASKLQRHHDEWMRGNSQEKKPFLEMLGMLDQAELTALRNIYDVLCVPKHVAVLTKYGKVSDATVEAVVRNIEGIIEANAN
jgi:hypothetical protein